MTAMEPIDETRELTSNEEAASSGHHPLLNESILKCLFKHFSVPDLKRAREVCEHWKYYATPFLREKTVVRLEGTCPLCKSEWKSNNKKIPPHDHKETISLYRFILQAQTMLLKEREEVFYKNFHISQLNLYFIPRLRPEPTKYFLSFIKLLGHKVFHLTLDNVQFCPTESVYRILSLFRNLEWVSYHNVSVWLDPVSKITKDSNEDGKKISTSSISVPEPVSVQNNNSHGGKINDYLTNMTISGDWVSEEFISWERIFRASPQLKELNFLEVPKNEILNSISTLVTLSQEEVRLKKLVILPRGRMEDQLDQLPSAFEAGSAANLNNVGDYEDNEDDYSESDWSSDNNNQMTINYKNIMNPTSFKNRYIRDESKEEEEEINPTPNPNPTVKKKLELESLNFNHLLTLTMANFPITELTLRLPYHGEEGMKFPDILRAGVDKLDSLDLCRHSTLFYSQTQVQFRHAPFELTIAERNRDRDQNRVGNGQEQEERAKTRDEFLIFPFIKKLSLAHNFIDNFDEIKTSFPSLESLRVNIVPTEFNPRKSKSYHTYLRTTLMLSMKNASVNSKVRELVWNIEEPRNPKTGIRTVVYKTNALRHLPKIFTGLVKLSVSITRPSDLHVIFRDLDKLEELTVLKNSFYRTKDEDIIGWADCDSDSSESESESESEYENESGKNNDDESSGIESKNSADSSILNRQRRKIKILPNPGIKQLKNLKRLSLENNNCCLTNKSLRHGFAFLQNLRHLYISRGKKITLSALRIMTRCPYLTSINVTSPNCGNFPPDEELVAAYQHAIITQPLLDIWNGKDKPIETQIQNQNSTNGNALEQNQQQEQDKSQSQEPQLENGEASPEIDAPAAERLKKSKIPSLVNRYTPPPSTRYSNRTRTKTQTKSRNRMEIQRSRAAGGILPPLISTTTSSTTTSKKTTMKKSSSKNVHYVKDSSLTLPPIPNMNSNMHLVPGYGLPMTLPVSPLKSRKKPEDIHPELEATDLKYILSLSESELEKYEEANKKKTKVMKKKKSDEPRSRGAIPFKVTGFGTGTGTRIGTDKKSLEKTPHPNTNLDMNLTSDKMTSLAHDLNISSKKLVNPHQKGGKFEKGEKYDKIGGRRYFFVKTKYKVNGRTYSLVRRKYENEGEKEKIYAKQRAWLARKRLQQTREAAKLKNGGKSGLLEELDEQALAALRKSIEENEEESEYERSIKEYDEDDEMDELEEYCDEDNIDNEDLVTPVSSDEEEGSDSETSAEEGIFLDDPYYEGDKEFYDYDFDSGQEDGAKQEQGQEKQQEKQQGETDNENPRRKNSISHNKSSAGKKKSKKSSSATAENEPEISGKKRVSFQQNDDEDQEEKSTRTSTRIKTRTRSRSRSSSRSNMISPDKNGMIIEKRRRSRSRSQSRCSNSNPASPINHNHNHPQIYSRSNSSCNNYPLYPQVIEYIPSRVIPQKYEPADYTYDYRISGDGGNNMYRKSTVKHIHRSSSRLENHHGDDNRNRSRSRLNELDFPPTLDSDFDFDSSNSTNNGNIIRTIQTVEKINVEKIVEIRKKREIEVPSPAFELELERAVEKMNEELHAPPETLTINPPIPILRENDDDCGNNYNSQMSENETEQESEYLSQSRKNVHHPHIMLNRTDSESQSYGQDQEQDVDVYREVDPEEVPIQSKYISSHPQRFQQDGSEVEDPYHVDRGFEKTLQSARSKIVQELQDDAFKTKPKVIPTFD